MVQPYQRRLVLCQCQRGGARLRAIDSTARLDRFGLTNVSLVKESFLQSAENLKTL